MFVTTSKSAPRCSPNTHTRCRARKESRTEARVLPCVPAPVPTGDFCSSFTAVCTQQVAECIDSLLLTLHSATFGFCKQADEKCANGYSTVRFQAREDAVLTSFSNHPDLDTRHCSWPRDTQNIHSCSGPAAACGRGKGVKASGLVAETLEGKPASHTAAPEFGSYLRLLLMQSSEGTDGDGSSNWAAATHLQGWVVILAADLSCCEHVGRGPADGNSLPGS